MNKKIDGFFSENKDKRWLNKQFILRCYTKPGGLLWIRLFYLF